MKSLLNMYCERCVLLYADVLIAAIASIGSAQDLDASNPIANGIAIPEVGAPMLYGSGPCSGVLLGDANQDGLVDLLDVGPMAFLVFTGGYSCEGDVNQDNFVNVFDIPCFINILTQV